MVWQHRDLTQAQLAAKQSPAAVVVRRKFGRHFILPSTAAN